MNLCCLVKKDYFLIGVALWIITVCICLLNPNFVPAIVRELMLYVQMTSAREAEDRKVCGNKFCHHEAFPGFLAHASLPFLNCYFIYR